MFHYVVILIKWSAFKDIRHVGLIAQTIYEINIVYSIGLHITSQEVMKLYKY